MLHRYADLEIVMRELLDWMQGSSVAVCENVQILKASEEMLQKAEVLVQLFTLAQCRSVSCPPGQPVASTLSSVLSLTLSLSLSVCVCVCVCVCVRACLCVCVWAGQGLTFPNYPG